LPSGDEVCLARHSIKLLLFVLGRDWFILDFD